MGKQDLLDALALKFTAVLQVSLADTLGAVNYYVANVFDTSGDTGRRKNVGFYVVDEGQPAEAAYWQGREPKPAPGPPTFAQELVTYLNTKIADNTILFYNIVDALASVEKARVDVTMDQAGTYVEAKLGVYKDGGGNFQYVVVT